MRSDERELTDEERARLPELVDETAFPVYVTSEPTVDPLSERSLAGEARGWWPYSARRVVLSEVCFTEPGYTDELLAGLLAHEVGHHQGHHGLLAKCLKAWWLVAGVVVFYGGVWGGMLLWASTREWWLAALGLSGTGIVYLGALVSTSVFSRWIEHDADRRGARLLGTTEPFEALCAPCAGLPYGSWVDELLHQQPHPADRLARLQALRDDLDQDDSDDR
jgi:Zn-dependent protease with chaperone function